MRKLLLAFAGLSLVVATAQEARKDLGRSAAMYTASHADGTPLNTSSNKSAAAVNDRYCTKCIRRRVWTQNQFSCE